MSFEEYSLQSNAMFITPNEFTAKAFSFSNSHASTFVYAEAFMTISGFSNSKISLKPLKFVISADLLFVE